MKSLYSINLKIKLTNKSKFIHKLRFLKQIKQNFVPEEIKHHIHHIFWGPSYYEENLKQIKEWFTYTCT